MVRTKADGASRAVGAKSFRKTMSAAGSSSSSSSPGSRKVKGDKNVGNPYCPRPTPAWQKEIDGFLVKQKAIEEEQQSSGGASSSGSSDSGASCSSSSS